jgi:Tfp pilus assembly protein PilO
MRLKKREKILIFFVILAVAIWVFDLFYYTPQKKKITALKEEVHTADLKLKESVLFTQGVETVEAEVARLEKELQRLNNKLLQGEEFRSFLKHLGSQSERLQMKMISMTTQEEKPVPPEGKKDSATLQYRKIAIQLVLHSRFNALRAYLQGIEELPFLVTVDQLQVERMGETTSFLKVTMGLSVFVVS